MKPKCTMLLDYIDNIIHVYDDFMNRDDVPSPIPIDQINDLRKNRNRFNKADENLLYFTDAVIKSFEEYMQNNNIGDGMDFERFNDLLDKIKILKGYREEHIIYKRQNQVLPLEEK